ncbi:MAG: hypothetical protein ACFFCW_00420 [Candidatus Hodarchaeota archaeon]
MPIVKMPDGKRVKFPDSMTPDEINQAISGEEKRQIAQPNPRGITGSWAESTWENIKKEAPEMIGGTVGGIAGGVSGGPPGAIGGAALGGAAGRAYKQLYQYLTESPQAPKTSFQAAKEIGLSGAEQAAYETVGGLVYKGASKVLSPFAKTLTNRGARAMKVLNNYMPKKYPSLLPAKVTEHRGLDWLHTVAEYSIGGGNVIFKHGKAVEKAVENMTDDLASAFGERASATELGEMVVRVSEGKWKNFKNTITTPLYNQVSKLMEGHGNIVSTLNLKNAIAGKSEIISKMKGIAGEESGDALVRAIQELPDMVDYATAQELRKRLYSLGQKFKVTPGGESGTGLAKHLTSQLDSAIDSALLKANKSAHYLWRGVNKIYREGSEKYNNALIRSLIKKSERDPHRVMGMIFQKGGVKGIERIKTAVGSEAWEKLQGWYIRDVIERSSKDGILQGDRFLKELFNEARGMKKEAVESIFGKEGMSRIKEIGNAIRMAQAPVGKSKTGGSMVIQLMQAGAVGGLFYGRMPTGATALLLGPYALARIMTNKKAAKWLTEGIKLNPRSAQFAATMARLTDFLDMTDKPEDMPH